MEEKQTFIEKFWYLFIIIAVFSLGSVAFLWMNNQNIGQIKESQDMEIKTKEQEQIITEEMQGEEKDEATEKLQEQSESDEINDIEYDLQTTNFTDIDKELGEIEKTIGEE